jgi:tetratricopeptide (TPR) repeat protein
MKKMLALGVSLVALLAAAAQADPVRNDYANAPFSAVMSAGLRAFYTRDFDTARQDFDKAIQIVPDNTLAISFLNATAAQQPGTLDTLISDEEDRLVKEPKNYLAHVRLGFSYMFATIAGRDRDIDAREEFDTAINLDPIRAAAHDGLGIMRENERSANRAKVEFLTALAADRNDVLAREYLASIYQVDLKDPQRALAYVIDIPNVVPDYADIYYHVASLFDDLNQPAAAIKFATRGLEEDIGHVGEAGQHGYTLLARIYIDQKKLDDARRVLKAAIAANTDVAYAQTLLKRINDGTYDAPKAASAVPPPGK